MIPKSGNRFSETSCSNKKLDRMTLKKVSDQPSSWMQGAATGRPFALDHDPETGQRFPIGSCLQEQAACPMNQSSRRSAPALPAAVRAAAAAVCSRAFSDCGRVARPAASTMHSPMSGDGPAVFVVFLAGAIVVGCALVVEILYEPPLWLHALLWLPLILVTTLAPLRPMKGLMIALAVPSQGGRRPGGIRRDHYAALAEGPRVASCPGAGRLHRADRAWHLAGRAQGLEGGADRDAGAAAARRAGVVAAAGAMGAHWR